MRRVVALQRTLRSLTVPAWLLTDLPLLLRWSTTPFDGHWNNSQACSVPMTGFVHLQQQRLFWLSQQLMLGGLVDVDEK